MNFLRQLVRGVLDAWRRLSASARVNIILAGLAAILVIALVAWFGAQPQYVTLSAGLTPQEATRIADVLAQNDIAWREEGNYERILVPVADRSRVQLLLAEANLPVGHAVPPGWELFQETELMTNQWLQNVRFMRAIQGELQKQLNAFDFVEYSHVLIREAPDELFRDEQKASEAAVTLKVRRQPSDREIKALVSLIDRAGGPHLDANNITITTTEGNALWLPPQEGFTSLASTKLEAVADWEAQREGKIRQILRDLGRKGTVSVSAQINFDEKEETREVISEGTELSTYTTETTTTPMETPPAGAPGAAANPPEGIVPTVGGVQEESTEEITNFEPSVTRIHTKSEPGNVLKYNVAVVVEGDYEQPAAGGEGAAAEPQYAGLTDEARTAIQALVTAAVAGGEIPAEVSVHDMPLAIEGLVATTAAVEEAVESERWDQWMQIAASAGQILLIIIGFLLVRRFLRRAIIRPEEEEMEEEAVEIPEATREDLRRQEVSSEISNLAGRDPDSVAALLRSWMTEEED
ncbi:MAG: flagellar M-ring protein FliF [Candidatus Hydrogenedentes bacterium]|nr:flagellar M-ring protein FliF [Candidatus Hydrogenedentota bacterium]